MRRRATATLGMALALAVNARRDETQQPVDPYATRASQCRHSPPPGQPLVVHQMGNVNVTSVPAAPLPRPPAPSP